MLDALKFVSGAIKKNGISPELEHFRINEGRVVGFNGYMALSAPIDLPIDAMPRADMFHKALQACTDNVAIDRTPNGRLRIRSGGLTVHVPCIEKVVFDAAPDGEMFDAPAGLRETFARMLPFIGDDASRPWAMGLAIGGQTYTATNNVILLQVWDGHPLPTFNCPRFAVAEVARIKDSPIKIQVAKASVTFHYEDGRWLRTQLLTDEWPTELMNKIFDRPSVQERLPEGFFEAVDILAPFAADASSPIYLSPRGLSTGDPEIDEGAVKHLSGLADAAFKLKALQLLRDEVTTVDLNLHPAPCLFFGPNSRGAIVGLSF